MPVVHEMPDIGHGERADIEVTSLLHALFCEHIICNHLYIDLGCGVVS